MFFWLVCVLFSFAQRNSEKVISVEIGIENLELVCEMFCNAIDSKNLRALPCAVNRVASQGGGEEVISIAGFIHLFTEDISYCGEVFFCHNVF